MDEEQNLSIQMTTKYLKND